MARAAPERFSGWGGTRLATGIMLFVLGVALLAKSYFSLRYLWADSRDSPFVMYLALAALQVGLGAAAPPGAFRRLRP
jgi:hypothetical protein